MSESQEVIRLLREAERLLGMSSMHDDEKAALILTIGEWLSQREEDNGAA